MTVAELIEHLGGRTGCTAKRRQWLLAGVEDPGRANGGELVFGETLASAQSAVRSGADAAVVPLGFVSSSPCRMAVVAAKQPRLWFAKAAKLLALQVPVTGIHPSAVVAADAIIGEGVSIGPYAVIGAVAGVGAFTRIEAGAVIGDYVQIGEHCRIHPRVVVYSGTEIGNRVVVHAGAVLGADGFGYVRDRETGTYYAVSAAGGGWPSKTTWRSARILRSIAAR